MHFSINEDISDGIEKYPVPVLLEQGDEACIKTSWNPTNLKVTRHYLLSAKHTHI